MFDATPIVGVTTIGTSSTGTDCNIHPKHNQPKMLHLLSDGIAHLHQSSKSERSHYHGLKIFPKFCFD